jgi:hypothetical protein
MKYEIIDDYLYIDGKKIEIKFNFLSYERSVCCLSGEYEGKIITRQVTNEQDFCTNLVCDYDYEQYKSLFEIQGGSINLELMQDMKVLHGIDVEKGMMLTFKCIGCRIIDKELSYLFDKEHKKALVIARLKNMQQDFE